MEIASDKCAEHEYETQFFGFTPESFVDGVYNAVNDYTTDCFQELETLLKNELTISDDLTAEEIHEACVRMTNGFYKSINGALDRFEMYVKKNIFRIPPHVLLPEDKVHRDHQFTDENHTKIDQELEQLQRKIKAAKYVNAALKQENKDLDNAQEQVDNFEKQLDAMKKTCMDVGGLCDQAKKVHDLLRDGLQSGAFQVQTPSVCKDLPQKTKEKKIKIG